MLTKLNADRAVTQMAILDFLEEVGIARVNDIAGALGLHPRVVRTRLVRLMHRRLVVESRVRKGPTAHIVCEYRPAKKE